MGTSNLDRLIVSHPVIIQYHQCISSSSSSSQTSNLTTNNSQEQDQNAKFASGSGLKIQVPSSAAGELEVSNREYDPETPRSVEHRIPAMATCPPAPRKARSRVPVSRKRKAPFFPAVRIPADFVVYMDAMFALNEAVYVPDIVVGDLGNGHDSAKKLKLLPATLD